jgi:hypothetical protein
LPDEARASVLGKRTANNTEELARAVQLEYVRDYGFTNFGIVE